MSWPQKKRTRCTTADDEHQYRAGHPLAAAVVSRAKDRSLPISEVAFDYSNYEGKVGLIEDFVGKAGWLRLVKLSVKALETEDYLLFTGVTSGGIPIDPDTCAKLLAIPGTVGQPCLLTEAVRASLDQQLTTERQSFLARALSRSAVVAAGAALRPATQLACSLRCRRRQVAMWAPCALWNLVEHHPNAAWGRGQEERIS